MGWNNAEQKCKPPATLSQVAFPPIPPIIEKLVCEKFLENNQTEEEVAQKVCEEVRSKFPSLPEDVCEKAVKGIWNDAEQKCNSTATLSQVAFPPIAPIIEKLVCEKFLENNQTEEEVAQKVCEEVRSKFPSLPEDVCEKAVKGIWNDAEQKCSSTATLSQVAFP